MSIVKGGSSVEEMSLWEKRRIYDSLFLFFSRFYFIHLLSIWRELICKTLTYDVRNRTCHVSRITRILIAAYNCTLKMTDNLSWLQEGKPRRGVVLMSIRTPWNYYGIKGQPDTPFRRCYMQHALILTWINIAARCHYMPRRAIQWVHLSRGAHIQRVIRVRFTNLLAKIVVPINARLNISISENLFLSSKISHTAIYYIY